MPRLLVVPTLLLLDALFMQLDVQPGIVSASVWRAVQTSAVVFVLFAALLSFNSSDSALQI